MKLNRIFKLGITTLTSVFGLTCVSLAMTTDIKINDRGIKVVQSSALANWKLISAGDFNRDGTDDILWQNNQGQVNAWQIQNRQMKLSYNISNPVGNEWKLICSGDFNGDGTDDILWQNNQGQVNAWQIQNREMKLSYNISKPVGNNFVASTNLQQPRPGGVLKASKSNQNIVNGKGSARATLYYNGQLVVEAEARSTSNWRGAYGSSLIIGVDGLGNALFVEKLDTPTACGRFDTCKTTRGIAKTFKIDSKIAPYVKKIDLYVTTRNRSQDIFARTRRIIKESVEIYNTLPPEVKAAIAAEVGG